MKTKYIYEVPDLVFPVFPEPDGVTFDAATETVSMPLDYYIRIAEYKRDVDRVQAILKRMGEFYKAKGETQ